MTRFSSDHPTQPFLTGTASTIRSDTGPLLAAATMSKTTPTLQLQVPLSSPIQRSFWLPLFYHLSLFLTKDFRSKHDKTPMRKTV
jgi:hypothetical protein